jgi:hypothetical protein
MSLQPLDKKLRKQLENTISKARNVAEATAKTALERLCVGDSKSGEHLMEDMRQQRNKLRAHGRQIGDSRQDNAEQTIDHLVQEQGYVTVNYGIIPLKPCQTRQPPFDRDNPMIADDFKKLLSSLCGLGHHQRNLAKAALNQQTDQPEVLEVVETCFELRPVSALRITLFNTIK